MEWSPQIPVETDEVTMAERSDSKGLAKSRRYSDPWGEELLIHQPVSPDQPAERRGKDLLQSWPKDYLLSCKKKQRCWHISGEGRHPGLLVMSGACQRHLAPDSKCQERTKRPSCGLFRPCQRLWASSARDLVDGLQLFQRTKPHHRTGQDLLSGFTVLCDSWEHHHSLAAPGNWSYGRLHDFPPGIYHGNGVGHVGISVGSGRWETQESPSSTKPCTRWLLQKLQENIEWATMEFKPSKSHSKSHIFFWFRSAAVVRSLTCLSSFRPAFPDGLTFDSRTLWYAEELMVDLMTARCPLCVDLFFLERNHSNNSTNPSKKGIRVQSFTC